MARRLYHYTPRKAGICAIEREANRCFLCRYVELLTAGKIALLLLLSYLYSLATCSFVSHAGAEWMYSLLLVWCRSWAHAVIRGTSDFEIEALRTGLDNRNAQHIPISSWVSEREIRRGPLSGMEGILVSIKNSFARCLDY